MTIREYLNKVGMGTHIFYRERLSKFPIKIKRQQWIKIVNGRKNASWQTAHWIHLACNGEVSIEEIMESPDRKNGIKKAIIENTINKGSGL